MITLSWTPITTNGIDKVGAGLFSGRVYDVALFKNTVIVGTAFGGVWAVNRDVTIFNGFQTSCLSDGWDDPNVTALATGPDGEHQVYAGCAHTLTYFELAESTSGPQISVVINLPLPIADPKTINRIVIDVTHRRIVLATGAGVWWSTIPASPANGSGYTWAQATGLPGKQTGGLCLGTGGAIHAALWGDGTPGGLDFGIFKGTFSASGLTFTRSHIHWSDGQPNDQVTRISLASCDGNRNVAFAACSRPDKVFRGILKLDAATDTWTDVLNQSHFSGLPSGSQPGQQGTFNNCIAVAPDDETLVAFGWQTGTFVQVNGTFTLLTDTRAHKDLHGLRFVTTSPGEHTLFAVGDGGVLQVDHPKKASPTFRDGLNAFLPDLLFSHQLRNQYGTIDVSPVVDGLISGGLQDNGVKYLKTAPQAFSSWLFLEGADGGTNVFLANGALVCREFNKTSSFRGATWNAHTNAFDPTFVIPNDVHVTDTPRMDVCCSVITPGHRDSTHELLHAISAGELAEKAGSLAKGTNVILGLFGNDAFTAGHWSVIGTTTAAVTALGSMDGRTVFVGLSDGSLARLDTSTQTLTAMAPPPGLSGGSVMQFVVVSADLVFGLYAIGKTNAKLIVWDGSSWHNIPLPVSEVVYSIAIYWPARTVFIATDTSVYQGVQRLLVSGPSGPSSTFNTSFAWTNSSAGLPARSHPTHLRIGLDADVTFLYLSTYGRSVYRAPLTQAIAAPSGVDGKAGVTIVFGVIEDGGGLEFDPATNKLIIVPPRQPVEAVLSDLLLVESLHGSTTKEAIEAERSALGRIGAFVDRRTAALGSSGREKGTS